MQPEQLDPFGSVEVYVGSIKGGEFDYLSDY